MPSTTIWYCSKCTRRFRQSKYDPTCPYCHDIFDTKDTRIETTDVRDWMLTENTFSQKQVMELLYEHICDKANYYLLELNYTDDWSQAIDYAFMSMIKASETKGDKVHREELADDIAKYIMSESAWRTTSGNRFIYFKDINNLFHVNLMLDPDLIDMIFKHFDYDIVMDAEIDSHDPSFDMNIALAYCPNYEDEYDEFPELDGKLPNEDRSRMLIHQWLESGYLASQEEADAYIRTEDEEKKEEET